MVRYQDLGLVNTREMFKKAMAGGYAMRDDLAAMSAY